MPSFRYCETKNDQVEHETPTVYRRLPDSRELHNSDDIDMVFGLDIESINPSNHYYLHANHYYLCGCITLSLCSRSLIQYDYASGGAKLGMATMDLRC
jgi:hypothetical protein